MPEFFDNIKESVRIYVQNSKTSEGRSALHLVAKTNSAAAVQTVLDTGIRRDLVDISGNTALHVAAAEGSVIAVREILTYRITSPVDPVPSNEEPFIPIELVNQRNCVGETTVHLAAKNNRKECLDVLIEHGGNIYSTTDDNKLPIHYAVENDSLDVAEYLLKIDPILAFSQTTDNTLLHAAMSREMVKLLLSYDVQPSTQDVSGFTVLHNAIKGNMFKLLISLLMSNVSPNLTDNNGDTALHTAVRENADVLFVKALVVFGADVARVNMDGHSAYDLSVIQKNVRYQTLFLSVGAQDIEFLNRGGKILMSPRGSLYREDYGNIKCGSPIKREGWGPNDAAVLSVDGGAIRGLVAVLILQEIEKRTQTRIKDLFDWIGGSSTGSFITMACTYCGKTARDMLPIYMDVKNKVFLGNRPYKSELLESAIQEIAGDVKMSAFQNPKVIVTSSIGLVRPLQLHLFTNYSGDDELVWKVARASGAAPTYFAPFENKYLDGGIISNNPTLILLTEMRKQLLLQDIEDNVRPEEATGEEISEAGSEQFPKIEFHKRDFPKYVVSVGTGLQPVETVSNIDVAFVPKNPVEAARYMSGAVEMLNTLVEQICRCDGPCVEQAEAWCDMIGSQYHRLQPKLQHTVALSETDDYMLIDMCWETMVYIYQERGRFQEICDVLKPTVQNSSQYI